MRRSALMIIGLALTGALATYCIIHKPGLALKILTVRVAFQNQPPNLVFISLAATLVIGRAVRGTPVRQVVPKQERVTRIQIVKVVRRHQPPLNRAPMPQLVLRIPGRVVLGVLVHQVAFRLDRVQRLLIAVMLRPLLQLRLNIVRLQV